jgi:hypothetical protein
MFHSSPITAEYDEILDEIRVAFHEFIVKTSFYNTLKAISWMSWLAINRINPIVVVWQHYTSLKCFYTKDLHFVINRYISN